MSTPISGVIFDLDGTLSDTREDLVRSINHLREKHGHDLMSTPEAVAAIGRGVEHLVSSVLPDHKEDALASAIDEFKAHYIEHCVDATESYPGIPELLQGLRQRGVPTAVVTNKPQASADQIVKALELEVDLVLGASETLPRKPDPAMLLEAVKQLGCTLFSTIYVGDMVVDLECARRAACPFIGVDFGFDARAGLEQQTALCLDTVEALQRALFERCD